MTDTTDTRDYSKTLFLPNTEFPMRAGLPKKEPEMLKRWDEMNLYKRLREDAAGREKFVLHDGPPYANGNIHIGTALNKVLKDVITRSMQMLGYDSNYVPGWDCHGLPIEWKIEEQYRAKGKNKNDVPINEFRKECRDFAANWIKVQSDEFRRLGVEGDFETPYTTMAFSSEALIAKELMKFAMSGQLYRGSKPVMWSVVEHTALAEAEVEYHDYESDTIFVKFPIQPSSVDGVLVVSDIVVPSMQIPEPPLEMLKRASVVIWTTTPWTIPGNRAISYSSRIKYGLYEVTAAPEGNWAKVGDCYVLAKSLAEKVKAAARIEDWNLVCDIDAESLGRLTCAHPLADLGYDFSVPLLDGDHVTDEDGTGFVHTAPSHGGEDFDIWMEKKAEIEERGISSNIPHPVDAEGFFTKDAPGFEGGRVIDQNGKKGDANKVVIDKLVEAGALIARARLKHQYPHSWRSKKPIIFRNTPQWFVHMDRDLAGYGLNGGASNEKDTLRERALNAIEDTRFVPAAGKNRLYGMIQHRPDWVLSRQRAWGVPITVFVNKETGEILQDQEVNDRVIKAFEEEGADAWFADGAKERFLEGRIDDPAAWDKVNDILDVWFDSGSTHAFCLEQRPDLKWPADVYLEGSDQHRGWFHSSLLESCGTRGRAPYDTVITHGFTMAEDGRKMSKSLGNQVFPQDVIKDNGADILRLWVMSTDYGEDQRIGKEIIKTNVDAYRKLRNTLRWMLGSLAHFEGEDVDIADMPELERLMLHRLVELDALVRKAYKDFDFKRIVSTLFNFMTIELSAFYFDVRKDTLYCDPYSSTRRRAALWVIDQLFECLVTWLAPMLPFTMEEAWLSRFPAEEETVHLHLFPEVPGEWRNDELAAKWAKIRAVRRVITGALEIERREKGIGSSLEAAPKVFISDAGLIVALEGVDLAEVSITSGIEIVQGEGPHDAFRLDDVAGVSVVPAKAEGTKCARSWKVLTDIGADPEWPDLSPRDAEAMREFEARAAAAAQ
ncbi:isoleucyl-tRNA synthetase [Rhodobium orientis]|uniref:Isoleucine--tRNA ligase n=1 Tax=Rhodobium orientis TaxID=34017 RepID=A0A327JPU6_9HYPH|nr:isoleucine--tRNA ligase [Rhodobium orientis]MBB4304191.1 isoleucyl-tRNA synthetase [Rhodobium orientis]MBK5950661.1 isoleucine--tRNA ligase [Rhodobium orientis]RAI28081.1 isoleucine--tRNA ligase [Rhodobium orientis]